MKTTKTQAGYGFNLHKVETLNEITPPSFGARGSTAVWGQARLSPSHHHGDWDCSVGEGSAPC